jgi:hypothetical protein
MNRLTFVSIVGITLLTAVLLGCGTLGLAVRGGMLREQLFWLPPNTRYQVIIRLGSDAYPWDQRPNRPTALNIWVHGRGTPWHIRSLLHVPFGPPEREQT